MKAGQKSGERVAIGGWSERPAIELVENLSFPQRCMLDSFRKQTALNSYRVLSPIPLVFSRFNSLAPLLNLHIVHYQLLLFRFRLSARVLSRLFLKMEWTLSARYRNKEVEAERYHGDVLPTWIANKGEGEGRDIELISWWILRGTCGRLG